VVRGCRHHSMHHMPRPYQRRAGRPGVPDGAHLSGTRRRRWLPEFEPPPSRSSGASRAKRQEYADDTTRRWRRRERVARQPHGDINAPTRPPESSQRRCEAATRFRTSIRKGTARAGRDGTSPASRGRPRSLLAPLVITAQPPRLRRPGVQVPAIVRGAARCATRRHRREDRGHERGHGPVCSGRRPRARRVRARHSGSALAGCAVRLTRFAPSR
jgi:hypothetical protein